MTHYEEGPLEVTVNARTFNLMRKGAQEAFEKEVGDLDYDEASHLVGAMVVRLAQGKSKGTATSTDNGLAIVDSEQDGKQAFVGFAQLMAKEFAPRIDDEREIILNVTRNRNLWETIRGRNPKITKTYHFRNEPPQYA